MDEPTDLTKSVTRVDRVATAILNAERDLRGGLPPLDGLHQLSDDDRAHWRCLAIVAIKEAERHG